MLIPSVKTDSVFVAALEAFRNDVSLDDWDCSAWKLLGIEAFDAFWNAPRKVVYAESQRIVAFTATTEKAAAWVAIHNAAQKQF